VRSMTNVCRDMGILVVAEGIEKEGERRVLVELGCDLLQGYLFGRPEAWLGEGAGR
jgi:EAL domain-containing protein (putative c-di-GMP-specific phosphodiesterase class I)